ncbi:hypothetical protein [Streptomyces sp. enrichment culture]|uniref:hypothetical protein n=1 Tax=Streptomyces sp. enrichment culture TaxID=1795815 RepID=UPI003F555E5C
MMDQLPWLDRVSVVVALPHRHLQDVQQKTVSYTVAADQPTIRREKVSTTKAT